MVQFTVQSLGGSGSGGSTMMAYSKSQSVEFHSRLNSQWVALTFIRVTFCTNRIGMEVGGPVEEEAICNFEIVLRLHKAPDTLCYVTIMMGFPVKLNLVKPYIRVRAVLLHSSDTPL